MKLVDRDGAQVRLEQGAGQHVLHLTVDGGDAELFPDDAIALGSTLLEWARDRMAKEGLF